MKIAVISDIHDNLVNLEKCLAWCAANSVEKIICCGDVCNSETLGILANHPPLAKKRSEEEQSNPLLTKERAGVMFQSDVYLVRGNMELYDEDELAVYSNIINGGRTAVWEIGGKMIGACHEPFLIKEVFAASAEAMRGRIKNSPPRAGCPEGGVGFRNTIDVIFYGHTHKPWIEDKGGTQIVNPGTLGGVFSRATFAVYDTAKIEPELKILDLL